MQANSALRYFTGTSPAIYTYGPASSAEPSSPWPATAQTSSSSSACSPRAASGNPRSHCSRAASPSFSSSRSSCSSARCFSSTTSSPRPRSLHPHRHHLPTFIVTRLPHGISGLLISAILAAAMSNLSAALNSLSSTTIFDFYSRIKPRSTGRKQAYAFAHSTIVWGVLSSPWRHPGPQRRQGARNGPFHRLGRLRMPARSLLLGVLTKRASETRSNDRHVVRLHLNLYLWLFTARILYLVRRRSAA
jgi:hypothetical protein